MKSVRVAALMTAPRYECVYARNAIESALQESGIPLTVSGGVYYGQCMQTMLSGLCRREVDYALTVDFDSMFTAKHVHRLVSIVAGNDYIDALAAIQPRRGFGTVLASNGTEQTTEWTGKPLKVDTAHFGLTVIDLKKLRDVPKPWFLSVPNAEGEWDGAKIDDDVYFWRAWKLAGHSLYIDPGTRLGHLEEVVTVYDENMQKQFLYPAEWSELSGSTVD